MSFQINIRNYHTCECSSAMSGKDVLSKADIDGGSHIVAWRVNSYLRPLGWVVDEDSEVEFVDTSSFEGMEVYRRSLSFSLVLAAQRALGKNVTIKHSISDGYYWGMGRGPKGPWVSYDPIKCKTSSRSCFRFHPVAHCHRNILMDLGGCNREKNTHMD
jgi:hypothetical protein